MNTTGLELAEWLANHPAVEQVWHPSRNQRDYYDTVKRTGGGYGGLLSFVLKSPKKTPKVYDALRLSKGPSSARPSRWSAPMSCSHTIGNSNGLPLAAFPRISCGSPAASNPPPPSRPPSMPHCRLPDRTDLTHSKPGNTLSSGGPVKCSSRKRFHKSRLCSDNISVMRPTQLRQIIRGRGPVTRFSGESNSAEMAKPSVSPRGHPAGDALPRNAPSDPARP